MVNKTRNTTSGNNTIKVGQKKEGNETSNKIERWKSNITTISSWNGEDQHDNIFFPSKENDNIYFDGKFYGTPNISECTGTLTI